MEHHPYKYLSKINYPSDLKQLDVSELPALCEELRDFIITETAENPGLEPGTIIAADAKQGLVISAGENAVRVIELQAPGGKRMNAKDYLRGHPVSYRSVNR